MNKFEPVKKRIDEEKVVISLRLEESVLNKIDGLAIEVDISRNEFINQCIEFALNNLEIKCVTEKKSDKKVLSDVS